MSVHEQTTPSGSWLYRPNAQLMTRVPLKEAVFDHFQHGLIVFDGNGMLCENAEARRILNIVGVSQGSSACCVLLGCDPGESYCLTERAIREQVSFHDIRRDLETSSGTQAIWVSAYPLGGDPPRVLLQLRRGDVNDRRRRSDPAWKSPRRLRIETLGPMTVATGDAPLDGEWLDRRPGQLLRYLVVRRARPVTADEIGESLWRGATYSIARTVRTSIHRLRSELEPERSKHEAARYVLTCSGSYRLNLEMVDTDADEFESLVTSGLRAPDTDPVRAGEILERALRMYKDEFLADVPFAEWCLAERARLHDLACSALRTLAAIHMHAGDDDALGRSLERLASFQPLDEGVNRELIELDLRRGRGTDAKRRYDRLALAMTEQLGCRPAFMLSDLARVGSY